MSREERRNYERMMKSMERGPALPPAAKARAERNAARRSRVAGGSSAPPGSFSRRFWIRAVLAALAAGFLGFSLQWPTMPFALFVGLIVAAIVLSIVVGLQLLRRRAAAR